MKKNSSFNYIIRVIMLSLFIASMQLGYSQHAIVECDSLTWHGSAYFESGIYYYTDTSDLENPIRDTLHLTIHNPIHKAITRVVCGSYEWHDSTYIQSGDYTFGYPDSNGCTQVDTLHLIINNPVHLDTSVTACESYLWNGTLYTVSGDYTYAHPDAHDCWQVDTLHLTINHATYGDTIAAACETFAWHGTIYTEKPAIAPTYTIVGGNHNGCDSIVTLHLTIHHGTHDVFSETACGNYTWHGQTYTTSGIYTYPYNNEHGCPSVDTLYLTIHNPIHKAITRVVCGSYEWHDSTYIQSGDYTFGYPDSNGCTQVDTLHLTINNPVHLDTTVTACESYIWNGSLYTVSGDYTYAHPDAHDCWQVDTLHLTIHNPVHIATSVTTCDSYPWAEGTGQTYTTSGTYTYAHQDIHGCTQVDTLHLVITPNPTPFIFGDSSICYGDVATLTATGGETYQWSTEDVGNSIVVAMEGLYTVTATNMFGCSSTAEFTVSIAASPLAKKDIVGKSHADGSYYMLIYPEADLQYQWYKNNVVIIGATKQYYYPSDYTLEGSLDMDACYQVEVRPNDPYLCGIMTDCWEKPESVAAKIRILPNPNDGQFRLMLPEGTVNVQILNANGQVVMSRKVDGDNMQDMSTALANGLYFVKSFRQDGSFDTEKLIINR